MLHEHNTHRMYQHVYVLRTAVGIDNAPSQSSALARTQPGEGGGGGRLSLDSSVDRVPDLYDKMYAMLYS